jgi:hypothetical protein
MVEYLFASAEAFVENETFDGAVSVPAALFSYLSGFQGRACIQSSCDLNFDFASESGFDSERTGALGDSECKPVYIVFRLANE